MSAIGPGDHEEFCQRDEWDPAGGTGHDKWEKRLPDGRLLRTVIHRHKSEYGSDLKAKVLKQLEVDEVTFRDVIHTGKPATRPTEESEPEKEPAPAWAIRALRQATLEDPELAELTADEAHHLALYYYSLPTSLDVAEVRRRVYRTLAAYRQSGDG